MKFLQWRSQDFQQGGGGGKSEGVKRQRGGGWGGGVKFAVYREIFKNLCIKWHLLHTFKCHYKG